MKTVLCYGDSNTWGYDPQKKERFAADVRWPGAMKKRLGRSYRIIEEGMNGRTTIWDDPFEEYRNGKDYLVPCLHTHRPLDLVIIMLGTNDMKKCFSLSANAVAAGAGILAEIAVKSGAGPGGKPPKVLLISPILVGDLSQSDFGEAFGYERSVAISKELANIYRQTAEKTGCEFLDAAQIAAPSPIDGIHMDVEGHWKLAEAAAEKVREIFKL